MTARDLCPACLARNVVAVSGGPTCHHHPRSGLAWWPKDFDRIGETERLRYVADAVAINADVKNLTPTYK